MGKLKYKNGNTCILAVVAAAVAVVVAVADSLQSNATFLWE